MKRPDDPVTPGVTFDNYVIPQSVQRQIRMQPVLPFSGMMAAVGVIGFLAFVLGIMATLKFSGPSAPVAMPIMAPPAESAETETSVTRQQSPDLISTGSGLVQQAAVVAPSTPALSPEETMRAHSMNAQAAVNRNKLRMLREGVLAGVYTVTLQQQDGFERLVLTTINADLSRKTMGKVLQEAADKGRIKISKSLHSANGQTDMDTMLFYLVQTSLINDGTADGAEAAREMSRRAFAASKAKTQLVGGQRIYEVQAGDSLAYLSLQFYGRPSAYDRILDANRDQLGAPDDIQIGQRLIIPG